LDAGRQNNICSHREWYEQNADKSQDKILFHGEK
jgi:hypothetical protein